MRPIAGAVVAAAALVAGAWIVHSARTWRATERQHGPSGIIVYLDERLS